MSGNEQKKQKNKKKNETDLRVSTAAASKNTLKSRSHQSLHSYLQLGPMFVCDTHTRTQFYRAASKWLPVRSEPAQRSGQNALRLKMHF